VSIPTTDEIGGLGMHEAEFMLDFGRWLFGGIGLCEWELREIDELEHLDIDVIGG
jgi:hypothetical protein